ncbi:MAG: hypothetical protein CMO01_23120 [Thalassobius sp.]|nr:hypothetical protein [Thalassovita sp.]
MKKFLLLLLFQISCIYCYAQALQNGLILPSSSFASEDNCCIYSPKKGFKVYDAPNGKHIGVLKLKDNFEIDNQASYKLYFFDLSSEESEPIAVENFKEIGYEIWAISYFEREGDFVRVLNKDVAYWLSKKDIEADGFALVNWQEFLNQTAGSLMGFYANDPGLNLRKLPDASSEKLIGMSGDLYEITPLNENKGLWTRVKVVKYKEHPCENSLSEDENIEFEIEGWVKIIDESGLPNVWFYSRGC